MLRNKTKLLLMVSLLGLAPTMTHAGNRAGYAWATAATGFGIGAGVSLIVAAGSLMGAGASLVGVGFGKVTEDAGEKSCNGAVAGMGLAISLTSKLLASLSVAGAAGGTAGTAGFGALTFLSIKKAIKNFKSGSKSSS